MNRKIRNIARTNGCRSPDKTYKWLRSILSLCWILLFLRPAFAQDTKQAQKDSVITGQALSEIVVRAFEEDKKLIELPSAVFNLSANELHRLSNVDIAPAINTIPGVRMEVRSPGSYRLNIRGSSLRAPFGVRNVKVYYNGIPFTDPGGDTYLNQFSLNDYGSLQVIKGPSGSIYGAGTGGVVLLNSPLRKMADSLTDIRLQYTAGSYNRQSVNASVKWGEGNLQNRISYSDMKSDGYRDQSKLHHQTFSYESLLKKKGRQQLNFFAHYTSLFYETPGGLTLSQYRKNPRASRPASGIYPSAEESRAAVYQQAFFAGVNNKYELTPQFENTTILYGAYTNFKNPTIRNYEYRKEPHFGGRTVFSYHWNRKNIKNTFLIGAELQQGFFSIKDLGNRKGEPDTLQTDDQINNFQGMVFARADLNFSHGWNLTAGASFNHSSLTFRRLYPAPVKTSYRKFNNGIVPSIALLKKLNHDLMIYGNVSKGFSPPTLSELLPSTAVLNKDLEAEKGTDYEIGSRGDLFHDRLYFDVNFFWFNLRQSISQRRDSSGADYFVNAGGTRQHGLEAYFSYTFFQHAASFITAIKSGLSQTWFHFRYQDYEAPGKNYSGNPLPGVAPYTSVLGLDIFSRPGIAAHFNWNFTSRIPLNDANSESAEHYHLLGLRLEYRYRGLKKTAVNIFAGADNLLNQEYSLGNDVNAAAGRYYNAAPGINFFAGISLNPQL